MKTTIRSIVLSSLALLLVLMAVACNTVEKSGAWESATYRRDTELGKGAKTVTVEVEAEEQVITFTLHTDKTTVGEALLEQELIAGEQGAYGLYVKVVNGMEADYDKDQTYWAFYINGEYAMTGVDGTAINENDTYRLTYTK